MSKRRFWFAKNIVLISLLCGAAAAQQLPSTGPIVTAAVAPRWPSLGFGIKKANEQSSAAIVTVQVAVDETGRVTAAKLVKVHPLFANVSLDAAKRWRFAPGEKDRLAELTFLFVVFNRGTPEELGTIFRPPYEVESRIELPPDTPLP